MKGCCWRMPVVNGLFRRLEKQSCGIAEVRVCPRGGEDLVEADRV